MNTFQQLDELDKELQFWRMQEKQASGTTPAALARMVEVKTKLAELSATRERLSLSSPSNTEENIVAEKAHKIKPDSTPDGAASVSGTVDNSRNEFAAALNQARPADDHKIPVTTGAFDIAGRQYVAATQLAAMLGVSIRTLSRWNATGIGPPKIKLGKLVMFNLDRVSEWLASRESPSTRATAQH
jgi:predicted DNA-binding transcriptional regulator AlpA